MAAVPDLVPARMLNQFAYCPRLAYLEWVQGEWAENRDTAEGKAAHRRVDRGDGPRAKIHQRSLKLSSERLGLIAVLDLIESDGRRARPVEYKRGSKPSTAGGVWEPERVQLCAQGLLLREHGYRCNEGVVYFAGSKQRVRVRFGKQLVARTRELLGEMRRSFAAGGIPPPLEDSPKCPRCSLVSLCLPDEVGRLRRGHGTIRPLAAAAPATFPLVVQEPGSDVRLRGGRLLVRPPGKKRRGGVTARLGEVSQVVLMGGVGASSAVIRECCRQGVPIVHMSGGGWLYGVTRGFPHKNVELRAEQFAAARDAERSLAIARPLMRAKIRNSRVLLRRLGRATARDLGHLSRLARRTAAAGDLDALLGLEGTAARVYFGSFTTMLKRADLPFELAGRNRRPSRDPLNAMLSFAYALLLKDWTLALHAVGLDPLMGFYHQPRYGRPALALDLMEPFRPVLADSVVVRLVNTGGVGEGDFYTELGGVLIKPGARKRLIAAYEKRLSQQVRHPVFGYRCTYRRVFELEARLLARHLLGEIPELPGFEVR